MTKKEVAPGFFVGDKVTTRNGHTLHEVISWEKYEDWHQAKCDNSDNRIPLRSFDGPLGIWSALAKNLIKVDEHNTTPPQSPCTQLTDCLKCKKIIELRPAGLYQYGCSYYSNKISSFFTVQPKTFYLRGIKCLNFKLVAIDNTTSKELDEPNSTPQTPITSLCVCTMCERCFSGLGECCPECLAKIEDIMAKKQKSSKPKPSKPRPKLGQRKVQIKE
jgi:hypothetical protein